MSDLQIVTTPILLPPSPETPGESTALVPAGRASAGLAIAGRDTSYTEDRYVWSAISDGSGVYHFQYRPQSTMQDDAGSTSSGTYSVGGFTTWHEQNARSAITQYLFYAAMPFPSLAQSVSVYC